MTEQRIGSLLVLETGKTVGIVTEADEVERMGSMQTRPHLTTGDELPPQPKSDALYWGYKAIYNAHHLVVLTCVPEVHHEARKTRKRPTNIPNEPDRYLQSQPPDLPLCLGGGTQGRQGALC